MFTETFLGRMAAPIQWPAVQQPWSSMIWSQPGFSSRSLPSFLLLEHALRLVLTMLPPKKLLFYLTGPSLCFSKCSSWCLGHLFLSPPHIHPILCYLRTGYCISSLLLQLRCSSTRTEAVLGVQKRAVHSFAHRECSLKI